ncbi:hypothetical protein ABZ816_12575 [Actinosynnema sp. NPDC047251]|uniref:DUF8083 domain-containing protein n=1 Tax=Saccharothrix espanaensis (strain ATCC 51144 / DSM 44229 / JCM 9112 / NBRC 15066 / NRRL 15764) TaxID=1179773 RepID=K0KAZ0_SACES|nr:hypothetical protein [Saccharothrix espanaensis]CCH35431.1 hypothetical protein BN6_82140 [Saccharothrix espanaensis DSM 44229]
MPRPFVAYLRVYEPLSALDAPLVDQVRKALENGVLSRADVGSRERELWLRSQLSRPRRLLPGERSDGSVAPDAPFDVMTISPAEVPGEVGPGPLVCPLDLRARSAAALVGFLATSTGPLQDAALSLSVGPDAIRARAASVMAELTGGAVHVISTTWTVPLPWFALVDPDARRIVLAPRDDPERQVSWRVAMSDARHRVARARKVVSRSLGDEGPAKVLSDTARWLDHFSPDAAVELDYGGLVQLIEDKDLLEDSSAQDVNAIVDALEEGNAEEVALRYEHLREFWGELARRERHG